MADVDADLHADLVLLHLLQTRPYGTVCWPDSYLRTLIVDAHMMLDNYTESELIMLLRRHALIKR